jgi:hypothetical protein
MPSEEASDLLSQEDNNAQNTTTGKAGIQNRFFMDDILEKGSASRTGRPLTRSSRVRAQVFQY